VELAGTDRWEVDGQLERLALARKLVVITFYRWRHALYAQESLPHGKRFRERTSGGAWSEHRPLYV
jgi:hypothetical protein